MEKKNKLYVLIDKSLNTVYGCVQGGHAVAQWLIEHKRGWNNEYLIYLSADVNKWKKKLRKLFIDFTEFKEPDLDYKTTSLAVLGHDKLFKKLKLISAN
jgi:DNA polymerase sigma